MGVGSNDLGGWQHNYSSQLDNAGIPISEWKGLASTEYASAETACESGWSQISDTAYNGQLRAAKAVFNAGLCELKLNGATVARLPVQASDGRSSYPVHVLTRTDGSRITFYLQDGEWKTTTGESYRLGETANGWVVNTPNNTVEIYDTNGKLIAITDEQGQITTLSYNAVGQLEVVISPFNQVMTFGYSNNKLTHV